MRLSTDTLHVFHHQGAENHFEQEQRRGNTTSHMSPSTQSTALGAARIGPLADVNAQCLQCFIEASETNRNQIRGLPEEVGGDLATMTPAARQRLAQLPFLLIEMRFADRIWWETVAQTPKRASPAPSWLNPLPKQSAVRLARTTLTLAWHSARVDMLGARIQLGLSARVATILGKLALPDVDHIAESQYRHLRPRWEDRRSVWMQLLEAARCVDSSVLANSALRCMELVSGDIRFGQA